MATKLLNKYHGNIPPGAVSIMRDGPYGNRFVIGKDGDRDEVCDKFEAFQPPDMDVEPLRGKVLVCCCLPARCHGQSIIRKLEATDPMAKVKSIRVSLGRTITNPESQFEPLRLDIAEEIELAPGDDADKQYRMSLSRLKKRIAAEVEKIQVDSSMEIDGARPIKRKKRS